MEDIVLFSKREKAAWRKPADVFSYDWMPDELRNKIVLFLKDLMDRWDFSAHPYRTASSEEFASLVAKRLRREYGLLKLTNNHESHDNQTELLAFIINEQKDVERVLDVIEVCVQVDAIFEDRHMPLLALLVSKWLQRESYSDSQLIPRLNAAFQEHGFGYRIDGRTVIRVDSDLIHEGAVKPALMHLSRRGEYSGARDEFLEAYDLYRRGKDKAAIVGANNSLESMLKSICSAQRWKHGDKDSAKQLIAVCLKNGLVPKFLGRRLDGLSVLLESVSVIRNEMGAHGQGERPVEVPKHLVAYALHMTASAIVFLAEAHEALKKPRA